MTLPGLYLQKDAGSEGLVTCDSALVVKRFDASARTADFIASTSAVDSHGDVIEQESWVLNDYKSNPIVLYAHNARELPIGTAMVSVLNGKLEAQIKFVTADMNPLAEQVWKMVQEGVLRAVSVGFKPTDGRYEVRDGEEVFVWKSPILKEISVVPVPANPEALARAKALFAKKDIPPTSSGTSTPADQEIKMDPKELLAKIEALTAKNAEMTTESKALLARAEKAEAESTTAKKENVDLLAKVKTLETSVKALESEHEKTTADRDAKAEQIEVLEAKGIESEVEALVGKKIKPEEKEEFVELRKSNPALFTKMVAKRPDLGLLDEVTPKVPGNGGPTTPGNTKHLLDEVKKNAGL